MRGVNGATSVMGSVAALVVAILTGFNQALFVGAGLYLLAMVFITRRQPVDQPIEANPAGSRRTSQRVMNRSVPNLPFLKREPAISSPN